MLENSLSILHNAKFTSLITFYPLLPLFLLSKWLPLLPFFVSSYQRIENRKKHPYLFLILCKRNNCIQLLLLSCISRVRLYATPETAAHQAPPSLGFSRQEHHCIINLSHHGVIISPSPFLLTLCRLAWICLFSMKEGSCPILHSLCWRNLPTGAQVSRWHKQTQAVWRLFQGEMRCLEMLL